MHRRVARARAHDATARVAPDRLTFHDDSATGQKTRQKGSGVDELDGFSAFARLPPLNKTLANEIEPSIDTKINHMEGAILFVKIVEE